MSMEQWWNNDYQGKTEEIGKTCSSTTSFSTNLTRSHLGLNSGLRGEKPAPGRLSHETAYFIILKYFTQNLWDSITFF
jgi:hypothetical protein